MFVLKVLFLLSSVITTVFGRCGSPPLPFGAIEPSKDIFEENDTIEVKCIGGRVIPASNETAVLRCENNVWIGGQYRCTQIIQFTNVSIDVVNENAITPMKTSLQEAMVKELTDKDPQTCVALDDEQIWTVNFERPKSVVGVVLMVTNKEDELLVHHNHSFVFLSVYTKHANCTIKEHTHGEQIPIIFIIYECSPIEYSNNITLHLKGNGNLLNICDIEIFAVNDDDCGKFEVPIYSLVNVFKIQNQSRVAEYTCPRGYLLHGSKVKMCGVDGVWYPSDMNTCQPKIKCDRLAESETLFGLVKHQYIELDLHGNAIPEQTTVEYICSNASLAFEEQVIRVCQQNGEWSAIEYELKCILKEEIEQFAPEMIRSHGYMLIGLLMVIFMVFGMMIMLALHSKRIAKHLQYKWRELSYKQPRKVNPTVGA
ncbi:hypothetical protein B4U80_12750 [Leptotrombidium deliense]|uniref:Sushi domain-containing protein n=1 Tax=Leptotrombidium deliense TaxID=299467 RepID=A0A443SNJ9_9ACAR|nr:hypothetical protein B4U80_12750 [Leptotrombidium deliense]